MDLPEAPSQQDGLLSPNENLLHSLPVKHALALAIVRSRKERQQAGQHWKRKALAYQRQLKRCKKALHQFSLSRISSSLGAQDLLESLPEIGEEEDTAESHVDKAAEGLKKSAARLARFLQNVHAMHLSQDSGISASCGERNMETSCSGLVWQDDGGCEDEEDIHEVIRFMKETLVAMPPSSLRRTYNKMGAEFLEQRMELIRQKGVEEGRCHCREQVNDFVSWLVTQLETKVRLTATCCPVVKVCGYLDTYSCSQVLDQATLEKREGVIEQLLFLVEGKIISNSILSSLTMKVERSFNHLVQLSKVKPNGNCEASAMDPSSIVSLSADLFDGLIQLLHIQDKAINKFAIWCTSSDSMIPERIHTLEKMSQSATIILGQSQAIRRFMPLAFRMVSESVAHIISLLQTLASSKPGALAPDTTLKSTCMRLCGTIHGTLVQPHQHCMFNKSLNN